MWQNSRLTLITADLNRQGMTPMPTHGAFIWNALKFGCPTWLLDCAEGMLFCSLWALYPVCALLGASLVEDMLSGPKQDFCTPIWKIFLRNFWPSLLTVVPISGHFYLRGFIFACYVGYQYYFPGEGTYSVRELYANKVYCGFRTTCYATMKSHTIPGPPFLSTLYSTHTFETELYLQYTHNRTWYACFDITTLSVPNLLT